MRTTSKILAIATACALPIAESHAWPCMTPEQLKTALEAIWTESMTRSDFPFKIEKIEYASDGIPKSIEGTGITSEYIDAALTEHIKPFSLNIKDKADLEKAGERLEALSKELSVEDLEKRGVDINHLKTLGIENVREITFDSILKSAFFTNAQRGKAKVWFESKEKLERAIEDYANNYPYDSFFYKCYLYNKAVANDQQQTVTSVEHTHVWGFCFVPRMEGVTFETGEKLRGKIKSSLKNMLLYKNGREKVILLLLLDEATPKEDRLKWGHDDDNINGAYRPNNLITCDVDCGGEWRFLSHEIGHYLQMHFGLVQTYKNYQTEFAKQLLSLNNTYPRSPIPVPPIMREHASVIDGCCFYLFDKDHFACPEQLPLNEIFAYVQLKIRWQSTAEISNILGVYFNGNTLYLNALSDIRELKRIRYTHNPKSWRDKIFKYLGTLPEGARDLLQDIFSMASQAPLPKDMLKLLCQLHGRQSKDADNVACAFDCKDDEEYKAHLTAISDFIEAE